VRWWSCTPLDAAAQRALLTRAWLADERPAEPDDDALLPLTERLAVGREPVALVVDDLDHLADAPGVAAALARLWHEARARALPLRLVLVGTAEGLARLGDDGEGVGAVDGLDLTVPALSAREVASALPGWSARDRFLAWAVFGGSPSTLRHLDPSLRLATNVQRLVLDPEGPLHEAGPAVLARLFLKPERYAALVRALAGGARDWGELRRAVTDFTSSSQLAPYMASLEDHGVVRAERSLDARPRSRNRRYHLTDPFPASWYRLVLPHVGSASGADAAAVWREHVRDDLEAWGEHLLPAACRDFLSRGAEEVLPAAAREVGGLWGDGYDLPVAGTLRTGAPLYGRCVWGRRATVADAEALAAEVRGTRYGFGREARLRALFTTGPVDHTLRRLEARDPHLLVVDLATILGV
jgi:hypothetical protein